MPGREARQNAPFAPFCVKVSVNKREQNIKHSGKRAHPAMLRKSRGNPFFHFTTRKTGAIVTVSKKLLQVDPWILYLCTLCQGRACGVTSEYYSADITPCSHRKRHV
ncbi:F10U4 [Hyposoter didymator ichnovirus]|nr:F10U4 [Hyposoter didymator ichnovirus]